MCYLQSTAKLGAVEQRWAAQLAMYDFSSRYRTGNTNQAADALSRLPKSGIDLPADVSLITMEDVIQTSYNAHTAVVDCNTIHTLLKYDSKDVKKMKSEDPVIGQFLKYFETGVKPTRAERQKENRQVLDMVRQWDRMKFVDGVLRRQVNDPNEGLLRQLVLPQCLKAEVLRLFHDQTGHQGDDPCLTQILLAGLVQRAKLANDVW